MSSDPKPLSTRYAPSEQAKRFRTTGVARSSKRRMSAGRRAWYAFVGAALHAALGLVWATCRVTAVRGAGHLDPGHRRTAPAVIVYWHQMHVFCAWLLGRQARAGMPLAVLTSPSVSGEVPAAIVRRWGMRPVRGSSTRSAGEALRDMHAVIAKDRQSLVITADGPKGPRHEFKPGSLLLARMAKAEVIPMAYAASHCTRWRSWDEFILPWPFSRIAIVIGEPWTAPAGFAMADLPAAARDLQARLQSLEAEARQLLR